MRSNVVEEKSFVFALRVVKLYQHLLKDKDEYILSKQLLRSGTSVGANVREALQGQSKADFTAKMSIALKEASETEYWLDLLYGSDYLTEEGYKSVLVDCKEVIKLLTAIVKTSRELR